jgi:hypothetical protein
MSRHNPESAYVRMMKKVKDPMPGFCWLFEGALDQNGHGNVRVRGGAWGWKVKKAHQVAYEHHKGLLPKAECCGVPGFGWCERCGKKMEKIVIRHTCDVRNCVNPNHLVPGTHMENMKDMRDRGRSKNCGMNDVKRAKLEKELADEECPF